MQDGNGWRAIDPHGLIGDPAYDAANFFGNPLDRPDVTRDPARILLISRLVALAIGCSQRKILEYAAAHAALSACWSIDDPASDEDLQDAFERLAFLSLVRELLGNFRQY
jgi:streptomycin 6-kinase